MAKAKLHFLHISKTGGTAIIHALASPASQAANYQLCLHKHDVKLRDVPKGEKVFFFVRDPIMRFVSGFYSRLRQGKPRYVRAWSAKEKQAFSSFRTPNELAESMSSQDEALRQKAFDALKSIRHVATSYKGWFGEFAYLESRMDDIFFIGFQETLNKDFNLLLRALELSPQSVQLPRDRVAMHKTPFHFDYSLSQTSLQNLFSHFSKDYQFYAICQNRAWLKRRELQKAIHGRRK